MMRITIISYILKAAANHGMSIICVLSDSTEVFVLLVHWVYQAELQCKVKMEQ